MKVKTFVITKRLGDRESQQDMSNVVEDTLPSLVGRGAAMLLG